MESNSEGAKDTLLNSELKLATAERRRRIDYKAKYFTMRGYAVILAVALAAVVFGKLVAGEIRGMMKTEPIIAFSVGGK